jgi:hypothetical protein
LEYFRIVHDTSTHLRQSPGCLELEQRFRAREEMLGGAGECSGSAGYEIESLQSLSSLLRVSCLPRRRPGIYDSGILRSAPAIGATWLLAMGILNWLARSSLNVCTCP